MMEKLYLRLLFLLVALLTFTTSCKKDDPDPKLEVSTNQVTLNDEGKGELTVTANVSFTTSTPSWLNAEITGSKGDSKTLTLTADPNPSTNVRKGDLKIIGSDNLSATVAVTQAGGEGKLSLGEFSKVEFDNNGGTKDVTISVNGEWGFKAPEYSGSSKDWIETDPTPGTFEENDVTGNATKTIRVKVKENNTTSSREATIEFNCGGKTEKMTITQKEGEPYINIDKETLELSETGGTREFSIESNVDWTIEKSVGADWLTAMSTRVTGTYNAKVEVSAGENTDPEKERKATITVKYGSISKTVTVTQGKPEAYIKVSKTNVSFDKDGGNDSFTIQSNVDWSVKQKDGADWLTTTKTDEVGTHNATIKLTAKANKTNQERKTEIIVEWGDITHTVTVIQQKGDEPYLTLSKEVMTFEKDEDEDVFDISSNIAWIITKSSVGGAGWITITPGSGSNNKTIKVEVKENTTTAERKATVTVKQDGGDLYKTLTVTQKPSIPPTPLPGKIEFGSGEETQTFSFKSNMGWTITKSSGSSWLHVTPGSGNGDATITVRAEANNSDQRKAEIYVTASNGNQQTIYVTQKESTYLKVNKTEGDISISFIDFTAGEQQFSIDSNVDWQVSSTQDWCKVSPVSGSKDGNVTIAVTENVNKDPRKANVTVTGGGITRHVEVSQPGKPEEKYLDVTYPPMLFKAKDAEGKAITITSNLDWTANSNADWCKVSVTSGNNDGSIMVSVTDNTDENQRKAVVTVKGGDITRLIEVTQEGAVPDLFLRVNNKDGDELKFNPNSAGQTFSIQSNVSWQVSSDASWCTVKPASGSNNGVVTVNVTANTGSNSRTANVKVTGGGITCMVMVVQGGQAPYLTVNNAEKAEIIFEAKEYGDKSFTVQSNVEWQVKSNQSWCTVNPANGSSNGTVFVTVTPVPNNIDRKALVTVSGGGITREVEVIQKARYLEVMPGQIEYDVQGGDDKSIQIESNLTWTVTSNAQWCRVSVSSGSNNRTVGVYVDPNNTDYTREAFVTIADTEKLIVREVRVTQKGGGGDGPIIPKSDDNPLPQFRPRKK